MEQRLAADKKTPAARAVAARGGPLRDTCRQACDQVQAPGKSSATVFSTKSAGTVPAHPASNFFDLDPFRASADVLDRAVLDVQFDAGGAEEAAAERLPPAVPRSGRVEAARLSSHWSGCATVLS